MISYADIAAQAGLIQKFFTKYKRPLSSDLVELCRAATDLSEKWKKGKTSELSTRVLYQAISLNRIANAVLPLDGHPRAEELAEKLANGGISMIDHDRTLARDIFWEIECWHFMNQAGLNAELIDPPDIVWNVKGKKTALACKRIYSEKHIQRVLSNAVHQIEKAGGFGFAAFQLEDSRVPKNQVSGGITRLENVTAPESSNILQNLNLDFLREHERHFLKYFTKDRLSAALVATSAFVVLDTVYVNTQWTVWKHPRISAEHGRRVDTMHAALTRDQES